MSTSQFQKDATGYWMPVSPGTVAKPTKLDYALDWSDWLDSDTISAATWTVPAALTQSDETITTTTARVWLTGFVSGTTYELSCSITTAAGRVDTREFRLVCRDR